MREGSLKEDVKTLRRWDVKFVSGNGVGGDAAVLGKDPSPAFVRLISSPTTASSPAGRGGQH